jgi:hypothetical protein
LFFGIWPDALAAESLRDSKKFSELNDFRQALSTALARADIGRQINSIFVPYVTLSYDFG